MRCAEVDGGAGGDGGVVAGACAPAVRLVVSLGDRQMTESQKQIELTDLGPIASLTIPIPAEGGCVVLIY